MRWSLVAVGALGAVAFTQNIPQVLAGEITVAYTDTDGNGERADQRPPGAASYFAEVDETIASQLRRDRDDIVVLTADTTFLAYYPYYGFQSLTSHYANPLADFSARAAAIEGLVEARDPPTNCSRRGTPHRGGPPTRWCSGRVPKGTRSGWPKTCTRTTRTCAATR